MPRIHLALVSLVVSTVLFIPARVQADDHLTFMQAGAERLLEDLEFLLQLTSKTEQRQWENVEANVDIFLEGIDRERPLRIDILLGGEVVRYRPSFPISEVEGFLNNLDSFGIENKPRGNGFYELREAFEGYLRVKDKYGTIGEMSGDVPAELPDPGAGVADLLEAGFDVAIELENDAEGLERRRTEFAATSEEVLAALQQKRGESQEVYDLRKTAARHEMEEAERFFVEAERLTAGWITDVEKQKGFSEFYLSALPETSLQRSIELLSQTPSYFANVKLPEDAILRGKLVFPIDELRQRHAHEIYPLLKPVIHARIDERESYTDEGKQAAKQAFDVLLEILEAGADKGPVDGFGFVHPGESGKQTLIGGIYTTDAARVPEILDLIPKIRDDFAVEKDVDNQGEVAIHSVAVPKTRVDDFKEFFGGTVVYVGVGPEAVYFGAGENAVAEMKQAIDQSGRAADATPDPTFAAFSVKLLPWIKELDKYRSRRKAAARDGMTLKEVQRLYAEQAAQRQRAIEAFEQGEDTFTVELRREDDHVTGSGVFNEGVLRYIGKVIAKFSKDNLE